MQGFCYILIPISEGGLKVCAGNHEGDTNFLYAMKVVTSKDLERISTPFTPNTIHRIIIH